MGRMLPATLERLQRHGSPGATGISGSHSSLTWWVTPRLECTKILGLPTDLVSNTVLKITTILVAISTYWKLSPLWRLLARNKPYKVTCVLSDEMLRSCSFPSLIIVRLRRLEHFKANSKASIQHLPRSEVGRLFSY